MKKTIFITVCTLLMSAKIFAQGQTVGGGSGNLGNNNPIPTTWEGAHHSSGSYDNTTCPYTGDPLIPWCNCPGGACSSFGWWTNNESHPTGNNPFTGSMTLGTDGSNNPIVTVVLNQNSAAGDGTFIIDDNLTLSTALSAALGHTSITLLSGHYPIVSGGTYGTVVIGAIVQ